MPNQTLSSSSRPLNIFMIQSLGKMPNGGAICLTANTDGTVCIQPKDGATENSHWFVGYTNSHGLALVNLGTGLALGVSSSDDKTLIQVPVWTVGSNAHTIWNFVKNQNGEFAIRPAFDTNRNLNIPASNFNPGVQVIAYDGWNNDPNEKWFFISIGTVVSTLSPDMMLMPLCCQPNQDYLALAANDDGSLVVKAPDLNDETQRWIVDYDLNNNGPVIKNQHYNKILSVSQADNTTLILESPDVRNDHTVWDQTSPNLGKFALRPAFDHNRNLNVQGGGPYGSGTPVIAYHGWDDAPNEYWSFAFIPVIPSEVPRVEMKYTNQYDFVWNDHASGAIFDVSVYRPKLDGYKTLGYVAFGPASSEPVAGLDKNLSLVGRSDDATAFVLPVRYDRIGSDRNSGANNHGAWWRPLPPPTHAVVGSAFVGNYDAPAFDAIWCIRKELTAPAEGGKMKYADQGSGANDDSMFFEVRPTNKGFFIGGTVAKLGYDRGGPPRFKGEALCTVCQPTGLPVLSEAEVHEILNREGPIYHFHPDEIYMPMSVDKFLTDSYLKDPTHLDVYHPETLLGDLRSAEAYVFVHQVSEQFTDLQCWLFYGNNGKTYIHVELWAELGSLNIWSNSYDFDNLNNGEHVGDWEHVTLRVDNVTKKVIAVGYTSHGDTEWYAREEGERIHAYSALHMHGSYPVEGTHLELAAWEDKAVPDLGSLQVKIFSRNICGSGQTLDCAQSYKIIESNTFSVTSPEWLTKYQGIDWGPSVNETDPLKFTDIPFIGTYPYTYSGKESGPSTPSYKAE